MSQKFIEGRVVGRTDHTLSLFSLQFEAPLEGFVAGQFCRVGLKLETDKGEELVMRPYSLVNAPAERPWEIILTVVPPTAGGVLSRTSPTQGRRSDFHRSTHQWILFDVGSARCRRALGLIHRHCHRPLPVVHENRRAVEEVPKNRICTRGAYCAGIDLPQSGRRYRQGLSRPFPVHPVCLARGRCRRHVGTNSCCHQRRLAGNPRRHRPHSSNPPTACSAATRKWSPIPSPPWKHGVCASADARNRDTLLLRRIGRKERRSAEGERGAPRSGDRLRLD